MLPFTVGPQAGVLASTDEGATWRRHGPLLAGPGAGLRYPAVAESEPGRLLLLAATSTHRIYRSESPDGGATWSMPTEVTTLVAPESPFALTALARRRPDGRLEPPQPPWRRARPDSAVGRHLRGWHALGPAKAAHA